jgi:hypothetical protein
MTAGLSINYLQSSINNENLGLVLILCLRYA